MALISACIITAHTRGVGESNVFSLCVCSQGTPTMDHGGTLAPHEPRGTPSPPLGPQGRRDTPSPVVTHGGWNWN